jgi:hypothetical protein
VPSGGIDVNEPKSENNWHGGIALDTTLIPIRWERRRASS